MLFTFYASTMKVYPCYCVTALLCYCVKACCVSLSLPRPFVFSLTSFRFCSNVYTFACGRPRPPRYFFFGNRRAQPSSLKSGSASRKGRSSCWKNWRQLFFFCPLSLRLVSFVRSLRLACFSCPRSLRAFFLPPAACDFS